MLFKHFAFLSPFPSKNLPIFTRLATSGKHDILATHLLPIFMQKTYILPKTNSKYLAGMLYRLTLLFTIWAKLPDRVRRWELYSFLWRMIERCVILMGLLDLLHFSFSATVRENGQVPSSQWFYLYYILWPNCYSQKPQHNFPDF